MTSNRFQLKIEDVESWAKVAGLFLLPVVLIYLAFVQGQMEDGFAWSDFIPNQFVQGAMVAYLINEIVALIKKWVEVKKY